MNPYKYGSGGSCSVKKCYNNQRKLFAIGNRECLVHPFQLRRDCLCPLPFKYYVPQNADQREIWVSQLRLTNPPKLLKVCSYHFVDGKPTEKNPLPVLHVGFSERNILVRTAGVSNCCFRIMKARKRKVPSANAVSLKRSRSNFEEDEDEDGKELQKVCTDANPASNAEEEELQEEDEEAKPAAATPQMQSSTVTQPIDPQELWGCVPSAGDGNRAVPVHAVALDTSATPQMPYSTHFQPVTLSQQSSYWGLESRGLPGAGDGNGAVPFHAVTLDNPATPQMPYSTHFQPVTLSQQSSYWGLESRGLPGAGDGNGAVPFHAVTLDNPATPQMPYSTHFQPVTLSQQSSYWGLESRGLPGAGDGNGAVPFHAVTLDNQLTSSAADHGHVKSATKNASCQWVDPSHHDYDKRSRTCFGDADSMSTSAKSDVVHVAVQCTIKEDLGVAFQTVCTDSDAKLYTGIGKVAFEAVVSCMTPFSKRCYKMHIADQILLTLMKLRLNLLFADLGRRFCISEGLASKMFSFWVDTLAFHFSSLLVWLPRETIRARMPKCFMDSKFSKTTCILDCAETFMEKPFNLESRAETYSSYKSHNTLKYLVSISPNGLIMFISAAYGGRASDRFIVQDSGILNRILPGDEILADRGFTIEDLLFTRQAKLNIPAFTQGKQLSEQDVTSTRRLANLRIHVERAIRRLKVFKILKDTAPVSMAKKFDKILIICAGLVNLKESIIRDK